MLVNIKVTGGLNIEWGQIDPKVTGELIDVCVCVCVCVCVWRGGKLGHCPYSEHQRPHIPVCPVSAL